MTGQLGSGRRVTDTGGLCGTEGGQHRMGKGGAVVGDLRRDEGWLRGQYGVGHEKGVIVIHGA